MPRRARVDPVALAVLAPLGVARVADLLELGVPASTIARRCATGRWRRLLPGVVLLGNGAPTRKQKLEAARLYTGQGSVVTGVDALRRHGLDRARETPGVLVLVEEARQRRSAGFVVIERTSRMPEPVLRGDVPVAPVERAVLDTTRRTERLDEVRAVITEAVQRGRTTVERLHRELAAGSRRGSALPRQVVREVATGIRSAGEGWALDVHRRSGLPEISWNPSVVTGDGRFLARPDGWFDEVAMAWEIDSVENHFLLEDWDETLRRRAAMQSAGIVVAHTRPSRLPTEPEQVVDELWGAYRLAASRPRPPVRALTSTGAPTPGSERGVRRF